MCDGCPAGEVRGRITLGQLRLKSPSQTFCRDQSTALSAARQSRNTITASTLSPASLLPSKRPPGIVSALKVAGPR